MVYENPNHTVEERTNKWLEIINEFKINAIDVSGLEEYRKTGWQRQLHLFEFLFNYIEYGIARSLRYWHVDAVHTKPKQALQIM